MQKLFFSIGAVAAGTAVILGAFGAHALKEKITLDQLPIFETGVRYQMYHAFALIILGFMFDKFNVSTLNYSGYAFILGIIFFSGSLYLLSMRTLLGIESWKFLGPITPLGGLCFISGWVLMLISVVKK
jgi:uncharacterized membrane protein YgdD (TMEM256/DUF423 family)